MPIPPGCASTGLHRGGNPWHRVATKTSPRSTCRASQITGGALAPVDLTKQMRFIAPDDGNEDDRTVMAVTLPAPVEPGETITLDIAFTAKIPRPFARTGAIGNYFFIAQWFPKLGVLDAAGRWNCHQFHVGTEFFSDFGVYDVRMTVPRGWPLAATGRERARTDNPDGTTTHRYYQEDVHDFAWTTSPDFLEARERFEHPGLQPVEMRLMLQPEHASQAARHFESARATLRLYGEWFGAYPYGHLTIVDPVWQSATDGMEYPTLFTVGTRWLTPREDTYLEDTVVHEAGPSMVVRHGGHQRVRGCLDGRRHQPVRQRARHGRGISRWPRRPALFRRVRPVGARRRAMGSPCLRGVPARLSRQPDRRHPVDALIPVLAADVRTDHVFEAGPLAPHARAGAGLDHDAADPLHLLRSLEVQAPEARRFVPGGERSQPPGSHPVLRSGVPGLGGVRLRRRKRHRARKPKTRASRTTSSCGAMATESSRSRSSRRLRTASSGGSPGTARGRWHRVTLEHASRVVSAQVDPDQILVLDTNFTNNSFTTEPASRGAATKWAAIWLVWLQDQLLTWAFFI